MKDAATLSNPLESFMFTRQDKSQCVILLGRLCCFSFLSVLYHRTGRASNLSQNLPYLDYYSGKKACLYEPSLLLSLSSLLRPGPLSPLPSVGR